MPSAIRVIDQASEIVADTANFDGILGGSDTDVQTALETLDDFSADPGGSNKQVQYNNSSAFGGATGFEWQNASPNVTITAQNAAHVPLLVKAAASQSANIQEWQDSSANVISGVDERGIPFCDPPAAWGGMNYFAGGDAGNVNTGGWVNVGVGEAALSSLTSGSNNVAIGEGVLTDCTTGSSNMGFGSHALYTLIDGVSNTACGTTSLPALTTGNYNAVLGAFAGALCEGSSNIFVGYRAGSRQTGSNFIIFDNQIRANIATEITNSIIYGVMAAAPADQTLRINAHLDVTGDIWPVTDNTYYLGKNDDDTPFAWKGVILKDTTDGNYYRIEVINGTVTATDLSD